MNAQNAEFSYIHRTSFVTNIFKVESYPLSIFELQKDALLQLTDIQLEELIARLAEAELTSVGESPARVSWSGSINSPDGGIDVQVTVPRDNLNIGFLARPNTIFQAKKHGMSASSIFTEMRPRLSLLSIISQQAAIGGSYIIVSLADDCSPTMKESRLKAMQEAIKDDPNKESLHLDFYDRSKLLQWLRQHPAVMLWVRGVLGQAHSGWQPYGTWSNPPAGSDDSLIMAPGVFISLPSETTTRFSIQDAIEPMRNLVRSTKKAIRINGLSGVGKTRIVQSLFDESIGENALDRTIAIYADTGANPDPSAHNMLERLIAENRRAIMVLDNCPPKLHSGLAQKLTSTRSEVSLITVEYDIRDGKPQATEVIHIEAEGPDIAEKLLLRRFPGIGQLNARKIAQFANGNARVSLAIAERVDIGESLAHLTDNDLFDRLFFQQKQQEDGNLRAHAEILSLVYSFSVSPEQSGIDELSILGSLYDIPKAQLFRTTNTLLTRHIAQKRSHWRAILPQAIANRLANDALNNIPVETLMATFESAGNERLLMSFAHRLNVMHEHPIAQEIVRAWLKEDGMLGQLATLNETQTRILDYIAPVAPLDILNGIEGIINSESFNGMGNYFSYQRTTILGIIQSLSYEPEYFDRCVQLLIRVSDFEDIKKGQDSVRDRIIRLFQPYLSGTHASLQQRITIVREMLNSESPNQRELGMKMLFAAFSENYTGFGFNDFGARPRDYGHRPNYDELVIWREEFIDLAVTVSLIEDSKLADTSRQALAKAFRPLWRQEAIREKLIEAAKKIHTRQPWVEGWKAVRATIYYHYKKARLDKEPEPISSELVTLEEELKPTDLIVKIEAYVLGEWRRHYEIDEGIDFEDPCVYRKIDENLSTMAMQLGTEFTNSGISILVLGQKLFSAGWMPYRHQFGKGLSYGSSDHLSAWSELLICFHNFCSNHFDVSILSGFIKGVSEQDHSKAQFFLDQCLEDIQLRSAIVFLHPSKTFNQNDFNRCVNALKFEDVDGRMHGVLLWREEYSHIDRNHHLKLASLLLHEKPHGDDIVLEALSMKLHRTQPEIDTLGIDLRRIGLQAAAARIIRDHDDMDGSTDHNMTEVIRGTLSFEGNDKEKSALLDSIFSAIDEHHGYFHSLIEAIQVTAEKLPEEFLHRIFSDDEDLHQKYSFFIDNKIILGSVDIDVLINWCRKQKNLNVWSVIASGINHWSANEADGSISLTEAAVKLVEAAPEPYEILETYTDKIIPRASSGSHAAILERGAFAIAGLEKHTNANIALAAKHISVCMSDMIAKQRQRETKNDQKQEQTFE